LALLCRINSILVAKYNNLKVFINGRFLTQQITGVQQFALEICRYLQLSSIEFVLLVPPGTQLPETLSHLSLKEVGKSKGYLWEQVELPKHLKKLGSPLLINFCNTAPLFYKNQWITVHDLAFMHHPEWFSKNFARVYRFLIPRIVKRSRRVFTVSKSVKEQLISTFAIPEQKVGILYNGIPHDLLIYEPESDQREKIILTVSSINPRKNLAFLIDVFLQSNLQDYKLVIVGAQNHIFAGDSLHKHPDILFTGYLSNNELYKLYHEAALFVSLSLDEGFGIPVLEALQCGCPVLLSDIDVYRECFSDLALFTSPHDVKQASFALQSALQHLPIAQGVQHLLAEYNYEASALALIKLLRETPEKM
jgi:glycosyltransferase involved in cell wall biosynthesis